MCARGGLGSEKGHVNGSLACLQWRGRGCKGVQLCFGICFVAIFVTATLVLNAFQAWPPRLQERYVVSGTLSFLASHS